MKTKFTPFQRYAASLLVTATIALAILPTVGVEAGTNSVIFQRGYVDEQYGFGGSLYMFDPTSAVAPFFFGGGNHPNYSPDGAQVIFADTNGDLAKTPADNYTPTNLVIAGGGSTLSGNKPKWSPDSTLVAFQTLSTNANKIVLTSAACTTGNAYNSAVCNYTKLDESSTNVNTDPAWFPSFESNSGTSSGRVIFVRKTSSSATTNDIYATDLFIEANGVAHEAGTTNLTQGLSKYEAPSYSHDGTKIIYVENGSLHLMGADGFNQHPIVSSANSGLIYGSDPAFSPDDSKIIWGDGFLYSATLVINANGSVTANNVTALTNSSSDRSPSWKVGSASGSNGHLSATGLTVNGSASAATLTPDAPIVFEASQTDTKDIVEVRVQFSTSPNSWSYLSDGSNGIMVRNAHDSKFILTTGNYPVGSAVSFRAVSKSSGQSDSISPAVGPFNIVSNKTHLPPTHFQVEGMTQRFLVLIAAYPLNFYATIDSQVGGLAVRLQTSTTPEVESSWADLNDGNSGQLAPVRPGAYNLRTGQYPDGNGIYFRVVSYATGMADSISNFVGPFELHQNQLPVPTITSPTTQSGSGSGTDDSPLQLTAAAAAQLSFSATASDADGTVHDIKFFVDGSVRSTKTIGVDAAPYSIALPTQQGKHTLLAVATDNLSGKGTASLVIQILPNAATAKSYVLNQSGDWNTASNWTPNGVPGPLDTADTADKTASIGSGVHITVASLSGGNLSGGDSSSRVTITKNFTWTGGAIANLTLEIANGGRGEIRARRLDFALNGAKVLNDAGATITVDVDSFIVSPITFAGKASGSSLNNAGEINFNSPTLADQTSSPFLFSIIQKQATKKLQGLAAITNTGTCHLNGVVLDLSTVPAASRTHLQAESAPTGFIQQGGVLDLGPLNQAGTIIGDLVVNGGTVTGSGAIIGNLTNNGGLIAPGHSGGVISVTGDFSQASGGQLMFEAGGTDANGAQYDQLQVGGTATLGGSLEVRTIDGFTPDAADVFGALSYNAVSGSFSSVSANTQVAANANGVLLSIDPTVPNPLYGQPANISTRMRVLTDDKVLIGGFIVEGPAGSTKAVLIRGLGPSLAGAGLSGVLADPVLELHLPNGSVVTNDNWGDAPNKDRLPNGFAPSSPQESIIIMDLAPGNYTVIERGSQGGTGIGLTEIYDIDGTLNVRLANISTRGFVDTLDNVLIGGFIIGGTEPAEILVRAVGPSLKNAGLTGVLEDPILEVHDANGNVLTNDDWREAQENEIIATTIPPSDDKEPAILATLVPGNYTAIVRGKDETTGIALVEVYKVK